MQANKNEILLDFATNADLANLFAGKNVGDKCTIEVTLQVREIDAKRCVGIIEKVSSEYQEEEKAAEPTPTAPIAIEMRPKAKYG